MTNAVKVEKVEAELTAYGVMKDIAKKLDINTNGLSRQDLTDAINSKIDELGVDKVNELNGITSENAEVAAETTEEVVIPANEGEQVISQMNKPSESNEGIPAIGENTGGSEVNTSTTDSQKKWYEDGYGSTPGERVMIIGKEIHKNTEAKKILQGREAVVIGPSKKVNTIQVKLIDLKDGTEQGCLVTLAFGEYGKKGEVSVDRPERKSQKKVETVVNEQVSNEQVAASSEEQAS